MKIKVTIRGLERWIDAQDENGDGYEGRSYFSLEEPLTFEVDGKKYTPEDFQDDSYLEDHMPAEESEKFQNIDVAEFFENEGATTGVLYSQKAITDLEIESEDGVFDPSKAGCVQRCYLYPDGNEEDIMVAFAYDGKFYECTPEDSNANDCIEIWSCEDEDEEDEEYEEDDED